MRMFLLHDSHFYFHRLGPALAASSCRRTFGPIHDLVRELHAVLESSAIRDRLTADESPLLFHCHTLPFNRRLWRHLAGELLLYAAAETPSFPTAPELLSRFMTAELIERLHHGSRDVTFAGVPYRPEHARLHDATDIELLARDMAGINPATWTVEPLTDLAADERDDELAFVRQCFGNLRAMFESARANGRAIVCEEV